MKNNPHEFVYIERAKNANGRYCVYRIFEYNPPSKLFYDFINRPMKTKNTPTYADLYRHIHNEKRYENSFCYNWYEWTMNINSSRLNECPTQFLIYHKENQLWRGAARHDNILFSIYGNIPMKLTNEPYEKMFSLNMEYSFGRLIYDDKNNPYKRFKERYQKLRLNFHYNDHPYSKTLEAIVDEIY